MSKSRLEWKVGLFVFIGLVLLAALLLEFSKGLTFFRPTYDIYLRAAGASTFKNSCAPTGVVHFDQNLSLGSEMFPLRV